LARRVRRLPKIELPADGGNVDFTLSGLFNGRNGRVAFAPTVSLPNLRPTAATRRRWTLRDRKNIESADYDSTIQTAFKEVSNA